jgi:cellulose synthase/poly-beta-1,6-N-acetylglucosamine synthase-like glycosyltransferase
MILFIVYFAFYFFVYLLLLVVMAGNRSRQLTPCPASPRVSILVAVRNEEVHIIRCLEALSRLRYPPGQVEILLGDDASTDKTASLIQQFIRDKPQFRYLFIGDRLGQARGKANVLAHLTRAATSDLFFITDADTAVPPDWTRRMLAGLKKDTGIVTGITTIAGQSLFARMQALDWINALGLMQVLSDLDLRVSTMGNNMLVTRQAYEATGGYAQLPFSVTEDVQLFQAVIRQGFGSRNIFDAGVLAVSTPAPSAAALWHQRKRWMGGVRFLPWYLMLFVGAYGSYYSFSLALGLYISWQALVGVFFGKVILQTAFITRCLRRLGLRMPVWVLLLFEFYLIFVSVISVSFFLFPGKITWKERKY